MTCHVITILSLPASVEASEACIASGEAQGLSVHTHPAVTPSAGPEELFEALGWPTDKFRNRWSRFEPALATFLSHSALWGACAKQDECYLILEHDAIITGPVPNFHPEEMLVCNVAKPSFGKFNTPGKGFRSFSSGPQGFFKGLHGYIVSPSGARELLSKAHEAEPADVYVNLKRFPWLTEYYPWSVECVDSVSTIQKEEGCRAKHRDVKPI